MSEHADLEALSAFVDGEAPEWAAHVAACPPCRATVDRLRAVVAAVATPVEPVAPPERDRAVAAAVALTDGGGGAAPAPSGRQPLRWLVPASVAAVFLLVVGAASLLTPTSPSDDRATTAAPSFESAPQADARDDSAEGGAGAGRATTSSAADLGEIPDASALLARARPALVTKEAATAAPTGPASSALASGGTGAEMAPSIVGTRPCEEQARTREPALREVVYFATATRRGVPAVVLGFSTGPAPAPVTLLLLGQDGCDEVLRAGGP